MEELLQLDENLADDVLRQVSDECRESLIAMFSAESETTPHIMTATSRLLRFARSPQVELAYGALSRIIRSDAPDLVRVMALDSLDWMRVGLLVGADLVAEVVSGVCSTSEREFRAKCIQVLLELRDPQSLTLVAQMYSHFRDGKVLDGLARTGAVEAERLLNGLVPNCITDDEKLTVTAALKTWKVIHSCEKVLQGTSLSKDEVAVLIDSRNFSLLFKAIERGLAMIEHCAKILNISNEDLQCSASQRQFKKKIEVLVRTAN